jgi:rhamnose utilization protein RhaD (predicted bifunctional aldolase and dehydrogenase)
MQSAWLIATPKPRSRATRMFRASLRCGSITTRLLGADRRLVLHGGGNTSLKAKALDLNGDEVDVLHVKGSGSDMAEIEPADLPALRLAPLLRLRDTRHAVGRGLRPDSACEPDRSGGAGSIG